VLFNSYEFIFLFLPITFALFWGWHSLRWRLTLLTVASFAFYSFSQFTKKDSPEFDFSAFLRSLKITSFADLKHSLWAWRFTIILVASSSVDYFAAKAIVRAPETARRRRMLLLALSLTANLGLLAFFKYAGFFSQIIHDIGAAMGHGKIPVLELVLPVGISFYTFESMSYVIDIYRGVAKPAKTYLDYACFISFFPHLVAGPIIRYSDILHQFRDVNWTRRGPDLGHVCTGVVFLTMGLMKKLIIADRLAGEIKPLWNMLGQGGGLGAMNAWGAVLGYTFQLYFDFSGYSDMATGLGHIFGVRLPQNFDSPYKAKDPADFWRRWHMTLSAFLRDYLYVPLGGDGRKRGPAEKSAERTLGAATKEAVDPATPYSDRSQGNVSIASAQTPDVLDSQSPNTPKPKKKRFALLQYRNLMITMLLGGLWHGAAWLFIIWGAWHGLLLVGTHFVTKTFGAKKWGTRAKSEVPLASQTLAPDRSTRTLGVALALCGVGILIWYVTRRQLGDYSLGVAVALAVAALLAGVALLKRTLPGGEARWNAVISSGLLGLFVMFLIAKFTLRPYFPSLRNVPEGLGIIFLVPMISLRRHFTFLLIVIGWVLFRAADVHVAPVKGSTTGLGFQSLMPAVTMFKEMLGLLDTKTVMISGRRGGEVAAVLNPVTLWSLIGFGWLWCNFMPNSFQVAYGLKYRWVYAAIAGIAFGVCVLHFGVKMDFLYFRF